MTLVMMRLPSSLRCIFSKICKCNTGRENCVYLVSCVLVCKERQKRLSLSQCFNLFARTSGSTSFDNIFQAFLYLF